MCSEKGRAGFAVSAWLIGEIGPAMWTFALFWPILVAECRLKSLELMAKADMGCRPCGLC
jgi:hypothetical protein